MSFIFNVHSCWGTATIVFLSNKIVTLSESLSYIFFKVNKNNKNAYVTRP